MSQTEFGAALAAAQPASDSGRRWIYAPYDQLSDQCGPLAEDAPDALGLLLIESLGKGRRRPYHKQKLALILANQRQFALEQARRGVAVRYVHESCYAIGVRKAARDLGPLVAMEPAERELRAELAPVVESGALELVPHAGWLTTADDFARLGKPPWRMDAFYRRVRQRTGVLMDRGKPVGGQYSFDGDNRQPWPGEPAPPALPTYAPDAITREVGALIEDTFGNHPGTLDLERLPATRADAEATWRWALAQCLPTFGPFEDAMARHQRTLWHTRVSPLLNIGRLSARRVLDDVLAADLPLASQEGFVRQLIGWREFVRHVHRATDGLRRLPGGAPAVAERPGAAGWDGGYRRKPPAEVDGGARPAAMGGDWPLPPAYWGQRSGLDCLDAAVASVMEEGYAHHIVRLMVLANLGALLDVEARDLTDWFWCAFVDAYDWVVEPNVLAMGTFAVGELMTTKPYVCGANYIDKMSDYCADCALKPKTTCPITPLYWAYLERHRERLEGNQRVALQLGTLRRRSAAKKARDARIFATVREALAAGEPVTPDLIATCESD